MSYQDIVRSYDYRISTRFDFQRAIDAPYGLVARAANLQGSYVLWDPNDNEEGFMLVGDDPEVLAKEAIEQLQLGEDA
jgi:hypothetical protein